MDLSRRALLTNGKPFQIGFRIIGRKTSLPDVCLRAILPGVDAQW